MAPKVSLETLLTSGSVRPTVTRLVPGQVIYSQGTTADSVMCVRQGRVQKSVCIKGRPDAVISRLGPGDFFGEACLSGHGVRAKNAIAVSPSVVLVIDKATMARLLRTRPTLANRFIAHLLTRNVCIEEDLIDQFVSSAEQRLARTLLRLAREGPRDTSTSVLSTISQTILAGMVGTTRPRINRILQKFKRLGFIDLAGRVITVHQSRLHSVSRLSRPV